MNIAIAGYLQVLDDHSPDVRSIYHITTEGKLYFYDFLGGNNPVHTNLWESDGTKEGTNIVFQPQEYYQDPHFLAISSNGILFSQFTLSEGRELWILNQATGIISLVKDICQPNCSFKHSNGTGVGGDVDSNDSLFSLDGTVYFSAINKPSGFNQPINNELWKSDGTTAGTVIVKEINPDPDAGSNPKHFININSELFFWAYNGSSTGLYKSDGTEDGTLLVKDIFSLYPTTVSGNVTTSYDVFVNEQVEVNGVLYFNLFVRKELYDGFFRETTEANQLWKSDGTESGTILVKKFPIIFTDEGTIGGIGNLGVLGNRLIFAADDVNPEIRHELWVSDGTESGTVRLNGLPNPRVYFTYDNHLYFGANSNELWKTDGTEEGTVLLKNIVPTEFSVSNDVLYFLAKGNELWKTDGTSGGTQLVAKNLDIQSSSVTSLSRLIDVDGSLMMICHNSGSYLSEYCRYVDSSNTPPTITGSPTKYILAESNYNFSPTSNDVNSQTLTHSIENQPDWLNFSSSSGSLSGAPQLSNLGLYQDIKITVSDGQAYSILPPFKLFVYSVTSDDDNDEIPDWWEIANSLNPQLDDSLLDPDSDGVTNIQEFMAGTDPQDVSSRPSLVSFTNTTYTASIAASVIDIPVSKRFGSEQLTVRCKTQNLSAVAGQEYTEINQILTWDAGDRATKTCSIPLLNNSCSNKSFKVVLSVESGSGLVTPLSETIVNLQAVINTTPNTVVSYTNSSFTSVAVGTDFDFQLGISSQCGGEVLMEDYLHTADNLPSWIEYFDDFFAEMTGTPQQSDIGLHRDISIRSEDFDGRVANMNLSILVYNAVSDYDLDGVLDSVEIQNGTDPLVSNTSNFTWDIDGDGNVTPLTDGLLTLRYLFGFRSAILIEGAIGANATRSTAIDIESYFDGGSEKMDIDGDGYTKPLTDGLLLLRYLFGFRDNTLMSGAFEVTGTRNTALAVESYIDGMME